MADLWWVADALADAGARDAAVVLATVVRTEGSTYRRAGARMLVTADGRTVGAVSGGCLEADLALRARDALAGGAPALVTYDTRADEDLVWGLGLGCNGRVDVLLEPLAGDRLTAAATLYARCRDLDRPAVLATVLSGQGPVGVRPGDHLLVSENAVFDAGLRDRGAASGALRDAVADDARGALRSGRSIVRQYASTGAPAGEPAERPAGAPRGVLPGAVGRDADPIDVLHEVLEPPVTLLVCGAGPDAVPVARLAASLGWRVTVADDRVGHARADRFPGAAVRLLSPNEPATAAWPGGRPPSRAAAVVMSHHYERDRSHVAALLATDVAYLGVLGPRRRTARLLADLGAPQAAAARLHAPVGLDLGAETPEEIALAIVAEVAGVLSARPATSLRGRLSGIHEPDPVLDATSNPSAVGCR